MMGWSVTDWSEAIGAIGAILGGLGYLVRLYLRNGYATKTELHDHHTQLTGLAKRMDAMEGLLSAMATKDDVNRVLLAIERADGDRRALAAQVSGINDLVSSFQKPLYLIQQALMQQGTSR